MSSARSIAAIASLPQTSGFAETATGDSFATNSGLLDHFAPAQVVYLDRAHEIGGRVGLDHDSLGGELGLEIRRIDHSRHVRLDAIDDLGRRLCRNEKPEPRIKGVPRHALRDR